MPKMSTAPPFSKPQGVLQYHINPLDIPPSSLWRERAGNVRDSVDIEVMATLFNHANLAFVKLAMQEVLDRAAHALHMRGVLCFGVVA
jgi:hypothetical protein